MGIDVVHLGGRNASHLTGTGHAAQGRLAFRIRLGEMVQVGSGGITRSLTNSRGTALSRCVLTFQEHHTSAFAECQPIPHRIKRAGDAVRSKGAQGVETAEDQFGHRIITAGEHAPGFAGPDHRHGIADGIGSAGAGIGNDDDRPMPVILEGDGADLFLRLIVLHPQQLAGLFGRTAARMTEVFLADAHRTRRCADDDGIDALHVG